MNINGVNLSELKECTISNFDKDQLQSILSYLKGENVSVFIHINIAGKINSIIQLDGEMNTASIDESAIVEGGSV
jgi:hypothetical protein